MCRRFAGITDMFGDKGMLEVGNRLSVVVVGFASSVQLSILIALCLCQLRKGLCNNLQIQRKASVWQ